MPSFFWKISPIFPQQLLPQSSWVSRPRGMKGAGLLAREDRFFYPTDLMQVPHDVQLEEWLHD